MFCPSFDSGKLGVVKEDYAFVLFLPGTDLMVLAEEGGPVRDGESIKTFKRKIDTVVWLMVLHMHERSFSPEHEGEVNEHFCVIIQYRGASRKAAQQCRSHVSDLFKDYQLRMLCYALRLEAIGTRSKDATSSFLFLVVRPGGPSSVFAPSSDRCPGSPSSVQTCFCAIQKAQTCLALMMQMTR